MKIVSFSPSNLRPPSLRSSTSSSRNTPDSNDNLPPRIKLESTSPLSYKCHICQYKSNKKEMIAHYKSIHSINIILTESFISSEDLEAFMENENPNLLSYMKKTSLPKTLKKSTNEYYNCSYKTKDFKCFSFIEIIKFKRNKNSISKINDHCEKSKPFCIKFNPHHNHETSIAMTKITTEDKEKLIEKIYSGVTIKKF